MGYIIILILSIIMLITGSILNVKSRKYDFFWMISISIIICIVSVVVLIGFTMDGLTDYPYLMNKKAQIAAYENRFVDIKNARYQVESGKFVGGSLDNERQSTNLTNYIKVITDLEAEYARHLSDCKLSKTTPVFWWFGRGLFIDKRVLEL